MRSLKCLGLVDIEFSFANIDHLGGNGINWGVERDASQLDAGILGNGAGTGPTTLNNVAVNAGQRIHFIVDPNFELSFDGTALTATITTVPTPTSFAILMLGLAGLRFLHHADASDLS